MIRFCTGCVWCSWSDSLLYWRRLRPSGLRQPIVFISVLINWSWFLEMMRCKDYGSPLTPDTRVFIFLIRLIYSHYFSCLSRFSQNGWRLQRCTTYMAGRGSLGQRSHLKRKTRGTVTKTEMVWRLKDNLLKHSESSQARNRKRLNLSNIQYVLINFVFFLCIAFPQRKKLLVLGSQGHM